VDGPIKHIQKSINCFLLLLATSTVKRGSLATMQEGCFYAHPHLWIEYCPALASLACGHLYNEQAPESQQLFLMAPSCVDIQTRQSGHDARRLLLPDMPQTTAVTLAKKG
jgi:hypothetical protein